MMGFRSIFQLFLLGAVVFSTAPLVYADELTSPTFGISDSRVTVGGGYSSSGSFQYISSTGQAATGTALSALFTSNDGALYYPVASSPVLSATPSSASIALNWTASSAVFANVTEYQYGVSSSADGVYSYTSAGLALSGTVSGLTASTTYFFKTRVYAGTLLLIESSVVSATTTAGSTSVSSGASGGGGGGGGPTGPVASGVALEFAGRAYPNTLVTLMRDAVIVGTAMAGADALFSIVIVNTPPGTYTFSLFGEDYQGTRSSLHTFAVTVASAGSTIGGIYIPPTLSLDQVEIQQGESLTILGQSAPNSTVTVTVHSEVEFSTQTQADAEGIYTYALDTTPFEVGSHVAKSRSLLASEMSGMSKAVSFQITGTADSEQTVKLRADFGGDGKVDLVDFSIAAYWFGRELSPAAIIMEREFLNGDGVINIVDMSIIAYYWSG